MTYYRELCKEGIPPIEATVTFLKRLASEKGTRGIKIGVCSAAGKQTILSHLKHLKIDHLIDLVLSGREDLGEYADPEGVNKPKPYIYIHAMKELKVSPEECVVIEDSSPGVTAGVRARCYTIAIPNEYTKRQDLSQAHWALDSFSNMDVTLFLKKLQKSESRS
jgi:beta-phosphoglucomutase-like phosphatase (HAD superfamily)